eukprot:CAMPEP_0201665406 /NCGR_PEP_ID=MMETSP0494-20130426/6562_1 /ASSEMBLY_ACC=CAM_ASM_000839 /TAXON_ID=420259 /ORGANISM="Thalassiosira gravida, Strain GMp14c1" /LENGTH=349 /DNA_ID=CAMNT_0048144355 /DNA_START=26 /DNA_END=1075 /DNA_ORIENTATION=+
MKQLILAATILLNNAPLGVQSFGIPPPSSLASRTSSSFETTIAGRARSTHNGIIIITKLYAEQEEEEDSSEVAKEEVTTDDEEYSPQLDDDDDNTNDQADIDATNQNVVKEEATALKKQLYQLAASYDRGFGATSKARNEADDIIERLAKINPTKDASRGIDGCGDGDGDGDDDVPLKAIWRMVWTSAFDVVSLGASPIAGPSAIYQDISEPPVATNIIDFIPRAQTLFPSSLVPPSLLRAEVKTRASVRSAERVGLIFESVKLQPVEFLGRKVDGLLPALNVDFTWPRTVLEQVAQYVPGLEGTIDGEENADALGYFEVDYLDEELLIIRQNAPGGVFALVKVDSCEP